MGRTTGGRPVHRRQAVIGCGERPACARGGVPTADPLHRGQDGSRPDRAREPAARTVRAGWWHGSTSGPLTAPGDDPRQRRRGWPHREHREHREGRRTAGWTQRPGGTRTGGHQRGERAARQVLGDLRPPQDHGDDPLGHEEPPADRPQRTGGASDRTAQQAGRRFRAPAPRRPGPAGPRAPAPAPRRAPADHAEQLPHLAGRCAPQPAARPSPGRGRRPRRSGGRCSTAPRCR